ncbi:MAG: hypothetical protein KKA32_12730, partial [Actinobacteria bacterium]|nr:hypothetical protein [Actinomycetota bacterium]
MVTFLLLGTCGPLCDTLEVPRDGLVVHNAYPGIFTSTLTATPIGLSKILPSRDNTACQDALTPLRGITVQVNATTSLPPLKVFCDMPGLTSRAGTALLTGAADALGLTDGL